MADFSPLVVGKRRSLLQHCARGVIESLENRVLLTVALDSGGWTQVTPTPGVSKLVYVSSSTGSDTNSGLSPSAPLATIAKAVTLMQNNEPDWILLLRGDTFDENVALSTSGLSAQQPMVLTYYGNPALPRPVIDGMASTALHTGSANQFVDIIGISFTSSTADPSSPDFTGAASDGLSDGGTSNLLVEDCSFRYFIDDVLLETVSAQISNVTIRRCEILDSYCTTSHSEGLYAYGVDGLTIDDNVFDHDGWNTSVAGAGATGYNHDCYLSYNNTGCVVEDNIFADASSVGLEARSGGIVDDNLFVNDPYGFYFGLVNGATTTPGGVSGQVIGNVVIEARVDTVNTYGTGILIGNLTPGGDTVVSDNIVADSSYNAPAIELAPGNGDSNPTQAVGLNSLTLSNNTVYNWGYSLFMSGQYVDGTTGEDGLTGVTIADNNFQDNDSGKIIVHGNQYNASDETWSGNTYSAATAPISNWFQLQGVTTSFASWQSAVEPTAVDQAIPYTDPTRTIESYMAANGLPASEAAFAAGAASLSATNWNPVYQAAAVINYIQAGFNVGQLAPAPLAVLTPPPNITPLNYQSNPNPTFTINYSDTVALDPTSISNATVTVTGPGSVTLPVTFAGITGSGSFITATYSIAPTAGGWPAVPNGTFTITLTTPVADTAGDIIPAQSLGSFTTTADPPPTQPAPISPTAPATTPTNFKAVAGTSNITLSWSDPANDQTGFTLVRATNADFTQNVVDVTLGASATGYTDSSVVAGQVYYYELIATNSVGDSAPTAALKVTLLQPPLQGGNPPGRGGDSSRHHHDR